MKFFKSIIDGTKIRIFVVGLVLTVLSLFIDKSIISLILLLQNDFFIKLFSFITLIGDIEVFIPVAIILSIYLFAKKKRLSGLWVSIFFVGIMIFLLKLFIDRERPYESQNVVSMINTTMSSFPSGHAMILFSILPILIKNFPKQKYIFFLIAILVAFSRVYLNVHYLSDIIAGAFLGYLIGMIFSELEDKYKWK